MKKIAAIFTILFAMAGFGSCSSDEPGGESNGEIWKNLNQKQAQYIMKLAEGTTSVTFKVSGVKVYDREDGSSKWDKVNLEGLCGWSLPAPDNLTIHQGRAWLPLNLFDLSCGPHPVSMPLEAYRIKTGFDKTFYVASPVVLDSEKGTMTIGKREYEVEAASDKKLELKHYSEYYTCKDGENLIKGMERCDITYKSETLTLPAMEKILYFDSSLEAYLYIIDMIREELGNEINLNTYFAPNIILDNPMVNLDEVEKATYETLSLWE